MRPRLCGAAFLLLVASATACLPPKERFCGVGSPVAGVRYPPVGQLTFGERPAYGQAFRVRHCSATLIGRRTILTAGHCLVEGNHHTFHLFGEGGRRVSFSATAPRRMPGHGVFEVKPGVVKVVKDLGLLTLAETPPLCIPRASITARAPRKMAIERGPATLPAFIVGVAQPEDGRRPGPPRGRRTRLPEPEAAAARHVPDELWMPAGAGGRARFVHGESGGPTVIHGSRPDEWLVVGVHSHVKIFVGAVSRSVTTRGARGPAGRPRRRVVNVDTAISAWAPWLRAASLGDLCEDQRGPAESVICTGAPSRGAARAHDSGGGRIPEWRLGDP